MSDDTLDELAKETATRFASAFGGRPAGLAAAPGRVNLIGDHTDYNDGFVLPMAIEQGVVAAYRLREDKRLRVHSVAHGATQEAEIRSLAPPGGATFFAYVAGVVWALREAGHKIPGLDLAIHGNVPIGAGLASSAAVELATARAVVAAAEIAWDPIAMAKLAQRAENAYVGVSCGLMDQFASAAARPGCALLLDCRSLEARPVPVPPAATIVVMDTGARRSLAGSAYNERRAACDAAVAALKALRPEIKTLRDVDEALVVSGRDVLDETVFLRALHVVSETLRPAKFAEALDRGDLAAAGKLMDQSHESLRDLYEVSSPELDLITDLARAHKACFGARLTGAGFGGCAVALVRAEGASDFVAAVETEYRSRRPDLQGAFFTTRPGPGARLLGMP